MKPMFKFFLLAGLCWCTAHADSFVSLPVSAQITENSTSSYLGVSLGTYDLWRDFGLRGNLEFKPVVSPLYYQAGADLLYATGEDLVFYVGAGGGYSSAAGNASLYASGTVGLDLDAASLISIFAEVQPRFDVTNRTGLLYLRGGLNIHL